MHPITFLCITMLFIFPALSSHTTCHIFIHGTSLIEPSLLIKSAPYLEKIGIKPATILNFIERERAKPRYQAREVLLEKGWVEIPQSTLDAYNKGTRTYAQEKKAAYPTIAFFSRLLDSGKNTTTHRFFTFGWSGTLLERSRMQASEELAQALCSFIATHKNEPLTINLYTHSHGGTVSLLLAKQPLMQQHAITIDNLIMFGTPLQKETALLAAEAPFYNVINLHSTGDLIQPCDIFSGTSWRPGRKIGTYLDLPTLNAKRHGPIICDIQLFLNHDPLAAGHHNMWLYNKIGKELPCLKPLPLVALTAPILQIAHQLNTHTISLHISGTAQSVVLHDHHKKMTIKAFISSHL